MLRNCSFPCKIFSNKSQNLFEMNKQETNPGYLKSSKKNCNGEQNHASDLEKEDGTGLSLEEDEKHSAKKQANNNDFVDDDRNSEQLGTVSKFNKKTKSYYICITLVWILALTTRLFGIENPPKVCWDETHFGKFANYYLNGTFFFDVHPPLGKMLLALAGWMSGYGGGFAFDKPGDPYGEEKYVGMRIFCALLGGFCIPLAFLTVYEITKSLPASLLAAAFIIFDTGHLTLSQYILLDPILMFFMMMSVFSLTKFQSWANYPFSIDWWGWMFCTGYFLACTFSVKWVGLFVILLAGLVTLKQLWDLLGDLSLSMFVIGQHFAARVVGLIVLPILTYLFFFAIHFQALPLSGPGDGFFSSRFQSTLQGSALYKATFPKDLAFGSIVTLKNSKPGGSLLHSHQHLYPKEHPPEQQQITGYSHKDPNNDWLIKKPSNDLFDPTAPLQYIRDGDIVRIEHVATRRNLHSHNEKAPLSPNLLQVSGYGEQGNGDGNDDWRFVVVANAGENGVIQTVKTTFKLIHVNTGCALGETDKTLPKWGWEQREMACYQLAHSTGTVWNIESHLNDRVPTTNMELLAPSFIESVYESHIVMAQTNNGFKPKEGEITSRPWQWPINYRGQVFSGNDYRVYLLGNPVIWWGIFGSFFVFVCVYMYHAVREQRGYIYEAENKNKRNRVMYGCIFLLIGWALHYFPFFAMGRVLYFHHYFPAYLFSAMFSGIFLEYLCDILASFFKHDVLRKKIYFMALTFIFGVSVISFYLFHGLSYGMSGPMGNSPNATQAAYKWLDSWEI